MRIFFRITVPLLSPTIFLVYIVNTISCFKVFSELYPLFYGKPGPYYNLYTVVYYIRYAMMEKRKYGYYTLPVLWGERFIGRIEAAADYKGRTLRVKNIWLEPGVCLAKTIQTALDRTMKRFSRFNGCSTVEGLK